MPALPVHSHRRGRLRARGANGRRSESAFIGMRAFAQAREKPNIQCKLYPCTPTDASTLKPRGRATGARSACVRATVRRGRAARGGLRRLTQSTIFSASPHQRCQWRSGVALLATTLPLVLLRKLTSSVWLR